MTFAGLIDVFLNLIQLSIPVLFGLTVLYLFWNVAQAWIIKGDANSITEGKKVVLAGIIALVVMLSLWGIVAMLRSSLF